MTEPPRKDRTDRPDDHRQARLGAALRANLARRKAQVRARARAGDTAGRGPTDTDNGQGRE